MKACDIISTYQQQANAGLTSAVQMEGWESGFPSISVHQTVWLRQLHWPSEGVQLSPCLLACVRWYSQLGQASGQLQCETKFMTEGLNACWASGFPPHSPGC